MNEKINYYSLKNDLSMFGLYPYPLELRELIQRSLKEIGRNAELTFFLMGFCKQTFDPDRGRFYKEKATLCWTKWNELRHARE
jgi:hypothetical protein